MSKTIFITGAGRRLGKLLAEYWLGQGWTVLAHFNSRTELTAHERLISWQANLADPIQVAGLAQKLADYGPIDAFIHNASCFVADDKAEGMLEHFDRHFHVHVLAPAILFEQAQWQPGAAACIITDIYADIPNERFSIYCASKAALQNWALSMAQRLGGQVRVNVVQPGPIQFLPEHDESYRQKVLSQSLIAQELGYDAIRKACDYLIGNEAVTGTVMRVDGGRFVTNRYEQTFS